MGAIANSNSTGEAGSAVGKLSEEEAERVALRQCAVGGAGDCKVQLTYKNQCSALVASDSESFFRLLRPRSVRSIWRKKAAKQVIVAHVTLCIPNVPSQYLSKINCCNSEKSIYCRVYFMGRLSD